MILPQLRKYRRLLRDGNSFWRRYRNSRSAVLGLAIIVFVGAVACLAPLITSRDPLSITGLPFQPPSNAHPMGTDSLGRDMLSRTVYAARVSLVIGVMAALASAAVGLVVGSLAGFYGGILDDLLMRFTDMMFILPKFFIALVVVVLFGPTILNITLVIGILSWPAIARLIRGEYITLREREFVDAARSLGSKNWDLMLVEILPNALTTMIVATSLQVGQAILVESALAFLGLGDPSAPSWGLLVNTAQPFLEQAWWISLFPGLFLAATVLASNLIGDGLNDAMNPALKER